MKLLVVCLFSWMVCSHGGLDSDNQLWPSSRSASASTVRSRMINPLATPTLNQTLNETLNQTWWPLPTGAMPPAAPAPVFTPMPRMEIRRDNDDMNDKTVDDDMPGNNGQKEMVPDDGEEQKGSRGGGFGNWSNFGKRKQEEEDFSTRSSFSRGEGMGGRGGMGGGGDSMGGGWGGRSGGMGGGGGWGGRGHRKYML